MSLLSIFDDNSNNLGGSLFDDNSSSQPGSTISQGPKSSQPPTQPDNLTGDGNLRITSANVSAVHPTTKAYIPIGNLSIVASRKQDNIAIFIISKNQPITGIPVTNSTYWVLQNQLYCLTQDLRGKQFLIQFSSPLEAQIFTIIAHSSSSKQVSQVLLGKGATPSSDISEIPYYSLNIQLDHTPIREPKPSENLTLSRSDESISSMTLFSVPYNSIFIVKESRYSFTLIYATPPPPSTPSPPPSSSEPSTPDSVISKLSKLGAVPTAMATVSSTTKEPQSEPQLKPSSTPDPSKIETPQPEPSSAPEPPKIEKPKPRILYKLQPTKDAFEALQREFSYKISDLEKTLSSFRIEPTDISNVCLSPQILQREVTEAVESSSRKDAKIKTMEQEIMQTFKEKEVSDNIAGLQQQVQQLRGVLAEEYSRTTAVDKTSSEINEKISNARKELEEQGEKTLVEEEKIRESFIEEMQNLDKTEFDEESVRRRINEMKEKESLLREKLVDGQISTEKLEKMIIENQKLKVEYRNLIENVTDQYGELFGLVYNRIFSMFKQYLTPGKKVSKDFVLKLTQAALQKVVDEILKNNEVEEDETENEDGQDEEDQNEEEEVPVEQK